MKKTTLKSFKGDVETFVILDTNIFIHLGDPKTLAQVSKILFDLTINKKFTLASSKYVKYELLRRGSTNASKLVENFNKFSSFEVEDKVLEYAALFYCLQIGKQKGDGDSIIASTAFLNKALILTENQKDFFEPFFIEKHHWCVLKTEPRKKGRTTTKAINIYLLENNTNKTVKAMSEIPYRKNETNNKIQEKRTSSFLS